MALDAATLTTALQTVRDPHTGQDFVSTKALKNLQIDGAEVAFEVVLGYPAKSLIPGLRQQLIAAAKTVPGVGNVRRLIVRRPSGEALVEIPLTAGVGIAALLTLLAPVLAALAAMAALVTQFRVEIERDPRRVERPREPRDDDLGR